MRGPFFLLFALASGAALAQAPAPVNTAPAAPKPAWMQYKTPYIAEMGSVSNPHRTSGEIIIWAQEAAAEVLSFGPSDYAQRMHGFKKVFVPEGWESYANYMRGTRFLELVRDRGYSASTIVSDAPEIIGQAALTGGYKWSLKLPLTISFYQATPEGSAKTDITGHYSLYMDVVRVEQANDGTGIAIAGWRVEEAAKR